MRFMKTNKVESAYKAQIAKLRREVKKLKRVEADSTDFLAFMSAELAQFPCCHEEGEHHGTPPMMWPELIACIVKRAKRDAVIATTPLPA